MKGFIGGILERILEHMAYATKREQALAQELAQVKDQLGWTTTRAENAKASAEERLAMLTAATAVADERLALLTASATLADERLAMLTAAATRAEGAEKELSLERRARDLAENHSSRLELRIQALKRRRERLQAELRKFQEQLARADVSGSIRELQEEKAKLQQRVADLQTYFSLRIAPSTAANRAEDKQGSANPR